MIKVVRCFFSTLSLRKVNFGVILFAISWQAVALNAIQIENGIPSVAGDAQWNQFARPPIAHTIEGYADQTSVSPGNSIKFYVHSNSALNSQYTLTVYRLGYYGGVGARRMTTPVVLPSIIQSMPTPDPVTGLVECAWVNPYTLSIPANWTSGAYIVTLVGNTTNTGTSIPFVVKQPDSTAAYVFQTSDTTWQAYNAWGGKSLYGYNSLNTVPAIKVSYNRPYEDSGLGSLDSWELKTIRFLEKNGYDVTYQSNLDTHLGGVAQLIQHKAFLSVGHDEYWSKAIRDNVENAKLQGLSLAFLGANAAYWQMRFENSPINGATGRTIVAYKDLAANDPIGTPSLVTGKWRDPLYANRPENALIGVMYVFDPVNTDIVVSNATHWAYTGTGVQNGNKLVGLLGYEVDAYVSNGQAPASTEILAHSPVNATGTYSDMTAYSQACSVAPCVNSTATVFATGSMQWSWGLDSLYLTTNLENTVAQQVTRNVLARMVNPLVSLPGIAPNNVNEVPSFVGGSTSLAVAFNSTAIDLKPQLHVSDINLGQTETWTQIVAPLHGALVINGATAASGLSDITPNGSITYKPTAGYSGSDSFTIQVSDGVAATTRTFSITVGSPANVSPSFVGGSTVLDLAQNSAAVDLKPNLHTSDIDANQTLTWSQSAAPLHGSLVITGASASSGSADITPAGTITYQPTAGYSGTDTFSIQVSDGAATVTRTFNVTVAAAGIGPNLLINPSLELDANANNVPDCWTQNNWGTNTFSWTRTATARTGSFAQQLQITSYTVGDLKLMIPLDAGQSAGGCAPAVQVGNNYQVSAYYQSTAPVFIAVFYQNAAGVWQYWKSSPRSPATTTWTQLSFALGVLPTGAKAVSFGVALDAVGTLLTDDYALVQNLSNTSPSFVGGSTVLDLAQNSAAVDLKPNLHTSDIDANQTLTWSQSAAPLHGSLVITGASASSGSADITPAGTITYQPTAGYSGTDTFSIQVSDGAATVTRTFNVTVAAAGIGPNLLINPSLELDANANNVPDCWTQNNWGTNTFSWTRTATARTGSFAQQLQITSYTVGDLKLMIPLDAGQSAGGCAPAVQVGNNYQVSAYYQSTAPVFIAVFYQNAAGVWQYWKSSPRSPATTTWTQLSFALGVLPTGAKAVSFGVALDAVGTLLTDDYALVQNLSNTSPSFVGGSTVLDLAQNSAAVDLKPNLHTSDIDVNQTLTWSQSAAPLHGSLVITGASASSGSADITPAGTITYQPTAGYSGTDTFSIQVSDGAATVTRTFNVTVAAAGIGPNLLINASLELDANADNTPDCWSRNNWGTNTFSWTRTATARTGSFAQQLQITSYTVGDLKLMTPLDAGQSVGGCAPAVQVGNNYQVSAYYQSTAPVFIAVFYQNAAGVWQYWKSSPRSPATTTWTQLSFALGVLPAGAKAVSFGVALDAVGTLVTDDYSLVQLL